MSNLLETVIEAHGGLERWRRLDAVASPRGPDGHALTSEPITVSTDLSEIAFT
jgi:hypothetical protein